MLDRDDVAPLTHDTFGAQKTEGQLLVLAWGAHDHRDRDGVDADFERLLSCDEIDIDLALATVEHDPGDTGHGITDPPDVFWRFATSLEWEHPLILVDRLARW